jgi:hypothetical protein
MQTHYNQTLQRYRRLVALRRKIFPIQIALGAACTILLVPNLLELREYAGWLATASDLLFPALVITVVFSAVGGFLFQSLSMRILLLRPFNEKSVSSFSAVLNKNFMPHAHVLTLSDKNFSPAIRFNFSRWLPFLPPALIFVFLIQSAYEFYTIDDLEKYNVLFDKIRNRYLLSVLHLLMAKPLAIRCTDGVWQETVLDLMADCDVIVMDLTEIKAGSAWEVDTLTEREYGAKTLWIAPTGSKHTLPEGLRIFRYDEKGVFEKTGEFEKHFWETAFRMGGPI